MVREHYKSKIAHILLGATTVSLLFSCSWFFPQDQPQVSIDEYAGVHPLSNVSLNVQKYDMYVDFSDGIVYAYNNSTTSKHMLNLVNKVLQSANLDKTYAMGKNNITDISGLSTTQFYNKVIDKKNYVDIMAPIEQSLKSIAEGNNLAILVTDYEEYTQDRRVQHQAYAADYFNAWLEKGGNIVFYAFAYKEKNIDKHLYITLFDNSANSLDREIQESFEGLDHNYTRFNLSNSAYSIATDYPSETKGGCNHDPQKMDDIISYTKEDGNADSWHFITNQSAEYYPFGESWADIYKGAKSAKEEYKETPKQQRQDLIDYKYLIGNLTIDFSELHAYNVEELEAVVYNIQDDFDAYVQYVNDSVNYDPNETDENNNPLPKPKYKSVNCVKVPDMLVFNGSLEGKKANVSIDFSPKFTGTLPSALQDGQTIAVDIVISKCQPDYSLINNLFYWGNNNSLEQSVRLTMQKFKPEGKVIYRYYIQNY